MNELLNCAKFSSRHCIELKKSHFSRFHSRLLLLSLPLYCTFSHKSRTRRPVPRVSWQNEGLPLLKTQVALDTIIQTIIIMDIMMVALMTGTDWTPSHIFRLILYSLLVLTFTIENRSNCGKPWTNQLPFNQNLALTESLRLEPPCTLDAFQSGEWLFLKVMLPRAKLLKVKYEEKKLLVLLWIRWVASKGSSFLTAHPGIFMSLMTSMTSIPICSACTADRGIEIKLHHIFSIFIALDISSILISLDT